MSQDYVPNNLYVTILVVTVVKVWQLSQGHTNLNTAKIRHDLQVHNCKSRITPKIVPLLLNWEPGFNIGY